VRNSLRPWAEVSPIAAVPGIFSSYMWTDVAFTLWFGAATMESLAVFEEACKQCIANHPGRMSSVHMIVPGRSVLPSAEARAALARLTTDYADSTAAIAVVIPGAGFWASAIRGLVTAIRMLGSREYELKMFATIDEVVGWLPEAHHKCTGVELKPTELLAALREVQRAAESAAA
jgi:hypothetical protein